jgi:hypothetical protein
MSNDWSKERAIRPVLKIDCRNVNCSLCSFVLRTGLYDFPYRCNLFREPGKEAPELKLDKGRFALRLDECLAAEEWQKATRETT